MSAHENHIAAQSQLQLHVPSNVNCGMRRRAAAGVDVPKSRGVVAMWGGNVFNIAPSPRRSRSDWSKAPRF